MRPVILTDLPEPEEVEMEALDQCVLPGMTEQ